MQRSLVCTYIHFWYYIYLLSSINRHSIVRVYCMNFHKNLQGSVFSVSVVAYILLKLLLKGEWRLSWTVAHSRQFLTGSDVSENW